MQLDLERTIVAVCSGIAPARRAIIRISGPQTRELLEKLLADGGRCSAHSRRPSSHTADPVEQVTPGIQAGPAAATAADETRGAAELLAATTACSQRLSLAIGWGNRRLPVQVYYWPTARSFTGEPSAELHLLGSLPLVEALVEHLLALGASPAERGEFTLRSFLAGKLDLTQAEAVLGVIEADTPQQLTQALQQLGGNLTNPIRELRSQLIELIAHLEAGLDFVEEDIEFISDVQLADSLRGIAQHLQTISLRLQTRGQRSRSPSVVLVGLPNAGKSSLFNALLGSERAIVSPSAGTTRDAIAESTSLGELTVQLIDTAGLEELQENSPRALAQDSLADRLRQADVVLLCVDLSSCPPSTWIEQQLTSLREVVPSVLVVGTKVDLLPAAQPPTGQWDAVVSPSLPASLESLKSLLRSSLAEAARQFHGTALHETAIRCRGSIDLARA
ncbi:MAG: 50S ribosome-binding GTPase, partial [Planctomycetales bacterium]|nr:50S ribosome-binding GTPase [Planctomycetales bacterium]